MAAFDKFEEYKLFIDDTARFSERRQTVSNTFVAINTLLLTAVTFLVKDSGAQQHGALVDLLPIPIVVAGILICTWWKQLIVKYKTLVGFRMKQLMAMEKLPEMKDAHGMYLLEYEAMFKRDAQGQRIPKGRKGFSDLESRLPVLFIILYAIFSAFLLVALVWQIAKP